MQFQSNILGVPVLRPKIIESTAQGAAYLAGIGAGIWKLENLKQVQAIDQTFNPEWYEEKRNMLYDKWVKAVQRTMKWSDKDE